MNREIKGRKNNLEIREDVHINDIYFHICESLIFCKSGISKPSVFRKFKKIN